jgi:hypothetical protein
MVTLSDGHSKQRICKPLEFSISAVPRDSLQDVSIFKLMSFAPVAIGAPHRNRLIVRGGRGCADQPVKYNGAVMGHSHGCE